MSYQYSIGYTLRKTEKKKKVTDTIPQMWIYIEILRFIIEHSCCRDNVWRKSQLTYKTW